MDINTNTEVSGTELAAVLGVTGRRIQQLAQDGIIESNKGKYLLADAVQKYMDFRMKEKALSAAEKEKLDADVSIKKAKAIVSVLEAKELQGKMHRSEDVAAMTEDLIYTIRSMLVALPGRLAVDVAAINTPAEAAEFVRKEVHKVMEELSNYRYDAKKYEERVRERRKWDRTERTEPDDE